MSRLDQYEVGMILPLDEVELRGIIVDWLKTKYSIDVDVNKVEWVYDGEEPRGVAGVEVRFSRAETRALLVQNEPKEYTK